MKKAIILLILVCFSGFVFAEEKFSTTATVPKLTAAELADGPELYDAYVYPAYGVPCTNFTYSVIYKDAKGRDPEYVRLWLNGKWQDMKKKSGSPNSGEMYVFNYVPDSGKQLFYYFEASNRAGKARAGLIDSPDQGPVLFSEKLDNNEIVLLNKKGEKIWSYSIGNDWVEGVAISKDGNYLAAVTNFYIYYFSKESNEPLWKFCITCKVPDIMPSQMAGIALSQDGKYIAGTLGQELHFFSKESNEPLWSRNIESGSIGLDMSDNGDFIAAGVANAGENGDKFFLFNKNGDKLIEYKPEQPGYIQTGNFYQPDMTPDGKYISVSTGCPDRRAYLFSNSGLIFRSSMLTEDSPVHKSAISDDGSLIAYSADHMQGKDIVFLLNNKGTKIWGFSSSSDGTARAVSMSADGNYIAAGTSSGNVYLFSKNSNKPIWKFSQSGQFVQFGDLKLSDDGSLLAVGATTKKVYLFSKDSNRPLWEYNANTWVTKIDFNGEYIAAGTGPREYFFEGKSLTDDKVVCKEIIQPSPREQTLGIVNDIPTENPSLVKCGNGICEPPEETENNCCEDCNPGGCDGNIDVIIEDEIHDVDEDENNFCSQFDGDREGCYRYPKECNWIKDAGICEDINTAVKKEIIQEETNCGNGICETTENCPEDCMPSEDNNPDINEEKSFFKRFLDFFKGLFGK